MSDLAAFRTLVRTTLGDPGTRYDDDFIDQALRLALREYSWQHPQRGEYDLTLTTTDRDQEITPTDYLYPIAVYFPDEATEYHLFTIYTAGGDLYIQLQGDDDPAVGDDLLLSYAQLHTIDDLDSATVTTLPADHEQHLALGAAAFAALNRAAALSENYSTRSESKTLLFNWGSQLLKDFRRWLKTGLSFSIPTIPSATGWPLDDWDRAAS